MDYEDRLETGIRKVKEILASLNIVPVLVEGRVKSAESMKKKQQGLQYKPVHARFNLSDKIGIRVVVRSDSELDRLYEWLLDNENIIFVKDYVSDPRQDGLIMGGNPNDVYKAYHVFTDSLNGVITEVQLRTLRMEEDRLRLIEKYGPGYWKSEEFRKRKYELGDKR